MSTYFVLYSINLYDRIADKEIIVESDCSGRELYEQILKAVETATEYLFTIKNIVCLGGAPEKTGENPLRVVHPSRPDLEINLYVSGVYNDRMDVNVTDKATGDTRSMCFELPADPRRL